MCISYNIVLSSPGHSNDSYHRGGGGGGPEDDRENTSSPGGRSNSQLARAGTVRKNINRYVHHMYARMCAQGDNILCAFRPHLVRVVFADTHRS